MKPILFESNQTDFTTNGIGRLLDAISCTVTEERNGQYELYMGYPLDGVLVEELKNSRIIGVVPSDGANIQPFRIYRISKPLSGTIEVDAEHISYRMVHIPVMPFEASGLVNALPALVANSAEDNPFTLEKDGEFGSVLGDTFKVTEPTSLRSLLFGSSGSIIDTYGGEWEFDRFKAILHKARGSDNGITIRYGKNLTELEEEESIESTYTGICPYWKGSVDDTETTVVLPEKVVHSTASGNYPYERTKIVDFSAEFETEPTVAELREKAEKYIKDNSVGSPNVSLDVSFVALHQTQEYADLTHTEHIKLCDTVSVVFPALGITTKAKVVKTVWNVLLDRYDGITIGAVKTKLSATLQTTQEEAVEQAVALSSSSASTEYATKNEYNALSSAVGALNASVYRLEDFRDALNGTNGGYVVLSIDGDKRCEALYILLDSPVLSSAKKVLRLDGSGLSYTSGGITNGSWTTVIGSSGKLSASELSGTMSLPEGTTYSGETMAEIKAELNGNAEDAAEKAVNSYDTALDQGKVLSKLQNGDTGFYLGSDGLLHMLPERIITGGLNAAAVYLPTTIVDGSVTSFVEARVVNGIIYPPLST